MTTIITRENLAAGVAGILTVTQSELDFYNRPETRAWWGTGNSPDTIHGDLLALEQSWLDRKGRIVASAVDSTPAPSFVGGVLVGPIGTDTASLITADGLDIIDPSRDFTLWCLSRDGTGSSPVPICLIGDDGGSLSIRHRDSLVQVVTYNSAEAASTVLSDTVLVGSDQWRLIELCYSAATTTLGIYIDGSATPARENTSWTTLTNMTGGVSLMGTYDRTDGKYNYNQDLRIAEAGVAQVYAPLSDWRGALHDMITELHSDKVTLV